MSPRRPRVPVPPDLPFDPDDEMETPLSLEPTGEPTGGEPIPTKMPVLPLRDVVIFPHMLFPLLVGREGSVAAVNRAVAGNKHLLLAPQKEMAVEEPTKADLHRYGTVARIAQVLRLPNGLLKVLIDGQAQATVRRYSRDRVGGLTAHVTVLDGPVSLDDAELVALGRTADDLFTEYVRLHRSLPNEVLIAYEHTPDPRRRLYFIAAHLTVPLAVKTKLLATADLKAQFGQLIGALRGEVEVLGLSQAIERKVQDGIGKSQRKFYLAEQIRILQEELGDEADETNPEFAKLKETLVGAGMPPDVQAKAMEELDKLRKIPSVSPEHTVIRTYLDWMGAVPWRERSPDHLDVASVARALDADHFGLEKAKDRILEHIAVLNLVPDGSMRGQILCLVGPPGVGKTSLGRSIAGALGRKFVRIALGGIRDEAEIRGHRRTYIGAMPGRILQAMKRAGTVNPVILLDEIDKLGSDFRGDPSSALLEVLDPEQNHTFNDHYLDVDYDLSGVLFITTANVSSEIPAPLMDRMEVIQIAGYLEHDKLAIARRFLLPKQLAAHGLADAGIEVTDDALLRIIREYTAEAGVRSLEREIAALCRKLARNRVAARADGKSDEAALVVEAAQLDDLLGVAKYRDRNRRRDDRIGSVNGLAWTPVGGKLLHLDVTLVPGTEKLTLTGQLGEVMRESAQAALTYLRSQAEALGLPVGFSKDRELHVHIPEGAIPKDGPSAGLTMAVAMLSALSNRPVRHDVAMTGEITLRGEILPIGGLNEKLLAAQRAGIRTVLIPRDNELDLRDIPVRTMQGLTIVPVDHLDEALPHVFREATAD